jgi:hypothetical protein
MHYLNDPHPIFLGCVEHKVWNDDKDANSGGKVLSCLSEQGVPSKGDKCVRDSVKKAVCGNGAMILNRDIIPDAAKVGANTTGECEAAHRGFPFAS